MDVLWTFMSYALVIAPLLFAGWLLARWFGGGTPSQ